MIRTRVIRDANDQPLHVDEWVGSGSVPVLVHHGSPSTRRLFEPHAEAAARCGLRLVSFDRPGYAGRPAQPGRCVSDVVSDVEAIAEALQIERMATWGFSGGGAYALACAALIPDLIGAAAVFASFAPYGSPGLDFVGGWPQEYRDEVDLFFSDRALAREHWRKDSDDIFAALSDPLGWMTRWGAAAGRDEAHGWDLARHLAAGVRDSLGEGDDGFWDDWVATLTPWGFDIADISVPVRLWHGVEDRNVPVSNGRWLAEHVPGIHAEFPAGEDHSDVEENARTAACDWLAQAFGS